MKSVVDNKVASNSVAFLKCLELSSEIPYIDFHHNKSTEDYTARIAEYKKGELTITGNLIVQGSVVRTIDPHITLWEGSVESNTRVPFNYQLTNYRWVNMIFEFYYQAINNRAFVMLPCPLWKVSNLYIPCIIGNSTYVYMIPAQEGNGIKVCWDDPLYKLTRILISI